MKTGRRKTPTYMTILKGNPGKRPLPKGEPVPPIRKRTPSPPRALGFDGRREWRRITIILRDLGMLTDADRTALHAYCDAYQRWYYACKEFDRILDDKRRGRGPGLWINNKAGGISAHPVVATRDKASTEMRRYLAEFGLTPSARSGLDVPTPEETNDQARDRWLRGG